MHPFRMCFFCLFYARENKWTVSTQGKTLWDKELQQAKILATILKLCSICFNKTKVTVYINIYSFHTSPLTN